MATKKTPRTSRTTRTRDETENEFNRIAEEEQNKVPLPAMETKARQEHETQIKENTKDVTVETVKQKLSNASLSMRSALISIEDQLQQAADDLVKAREAVVLEEKTLEGLYGKEIIASTIKTMLDDHQDQMAVMRDERLKMQNEYAEAVEKRKLEAEEYAADRDQARQREEDGFNYNLQLRRRADEDKYNELRRQKDRLLQEKDELLQKCWKEREEKLALAEKELVDLRAKVAAFPTEVDAAVKKAEAIVGNTLKRTYEHQMEMIQTQTRAQLEIANAKTASLELQLKTANDTIAKQAIQLASSEEKVASIATKALESASGQQALAKVQEFAAQQGNNTTSRKA